MAWFECHEQVRDEMKFHRLAQQLEIPYPHAVGLGICLWAYATGHQRNGDLSELSNHEIARICHWDAENNQEKDENFLINALKKCKLLDEDGRIHHWKKYGVKLLESNRKAKLKWRKTSYDRHGTVLLPSSPTNQPNQPNQPTIKIKIQDGATAPPLQDQTVLKTRLSTFMEHLQRKLTKATGQAQPTAARQVFGVAIAYLKDHPEEIESLSHEIDLLPAEGRSASWYVAAIRGLVNTRRHEARKLMERRAEGMGA